MLQGWGSLRFQEDFLMMQNFLGINRHIVTKKIGRKNMTYILKAYRSYRFHGEPSEGELSEAFEDPRLPRSTFYGLCWD